jgi:hypothetical protein
MKKLFTIMLCLALAACGHPKTIDGRHYPTYGLLNQNTQRSDAVCYKLSTGNTVWSVILIETIVVPIYFVGFDLFNPVGPKINGKCGIDART